MRLDQSEKPKNFFAFTVNFTKTESTIEIERLYSDFKRLHHFIISTFETEIKEYELYENSATRGDGSRQILIAPLIDFKGDQSSPADNMCSISLKNQVADEIY